MWNIVHILMFLTTFAVPGVLYGMGPQAAAAKLSISVEAASRITQTFFDNFKQIRTWIQQIKAYVVLIITDNL